MSQQPVAAPASLPKVDPETLAIRALPERAIRFRRGVIIAIAALGLVSLIATVYLAFRPDLSHQSADQPESSQPSGKALSVSDPEFGDEEKVGDISQM